MYVADNRGFALADARLLQLIVRLLIVRRRRHLSRLIRALRGLGATDDKAACACGTFRATAA